MKIAIVALPPVTNTIIAPPLPLGYVAAWIEQQRHIVRIYDYALSRNIPIEQYLDAVRAFRPNIVVVAAEERMAAAEIHRILANIDATWVHLNDGLRGPTPIQSATKILEQLDLANPNDNESVILHSIQALEKNIDSLPVPARHLLAIERYQLKSPSGALQTNVTIGQTIGGTAALRNPRTIVAELRSIVHENGVWHILFEGSEITKDPAWMHDFLYGLMMERLGVSWEATVDLDALTPELLKLCRRAGCEGLIIAFDAMQALDSQTIRTKLSEVVQTSRVLDLRVRGHVTLEPLYRSIPDLVDVAATFDLDGVTFNIREGAHGSEESIRPALTRAQDRYRILQARQHFVERYGAHLGGLIWRISQIGSIARNWHRLAGGKAS